MDIAVARSDERRDAKFEAVRCQVPSVEAPAVASLNSFLIRLLPSRSKNTYLTNRLRVGGASRREASRREDAKDTKEEEKEDG